MKRFYLFQLVLLCTSVTVFARPKAFTGNANQGNVVSIFDIDADKSIGVLQTNDGAGEIKFQKYTIDLGDINTDEQPLRVEFKFRNAGNAPLVIKAVKPTSRQLDASFPKYSIAPGAEDVIVVSGTLQSGSFKKSIAVMTTGNVEFTRLYISGNNTGEGLSEPTFVGESVSSWVNKHQGTIKDLPQGLVYKILVTYRVGPDNRIKDVDYVKQGLPQSIVVDINKLISKMPVFESGHSKGGSFYVVYNNEITNPQDKAELDFLEKDPVELLKIVEKAKRHFQNMDIKPILLWYVIERDGSISNIQIEINPDIYKNQQTVSTLKTIISEIRDEVKKRNVKSSLRRTRTKVGLVIKK